ncbi:phage scaffolding protein [Clostridium beijerinckii]|uniref:phage scaffolding protein n=1 Tax=Clostridium beijerinckii TaxID=1520 RepID=UPI001361C299|nr:phage scaffolding protein [Clostridium beijerinckii]MZK53648.1 hypothetical protein [Clostridium beijerinckii]MZK61759.1 hypothetical protein [Clostridium beijerinckii]MZK71958.1 hypothetical protein [Clostridium beijerinckii]MZK77345.1 hypothetical protein [Clostridium beijerinckii]MZK86929.1 hypothetical protein [Clostridium beijerinckii]
MKREFLKGLTFKVGDQEVTLPDEVINNIIAENGKDIEGTKTKLNGQIENLQSELKTKDEQLTNINSEMEKFKTMDIDGIKSKLTELEGKNKEYETQLETERETNAKKLQDQQYDFAVRELTGKHKFTNDFVKNAFVEEFKKQGLKLGEDGNFLGADDYIKGFQEKNPGVFAVEAPPSNEPQIQQFSAATSGGATPVKGISLLDAMKAANEGKPVDIGQVGRFANQ